MICAIHGQLSELTQTSALITCNHITYELQVPSSQQQALQALARLTGPSTVWVFQYLEADTQRLIAFADRDSRQQFAELAAAKSAPKPGVLLKMLGQMPGPSSRVLQGRSQAEEDAIKIMVQMGESKQSAVKLLEDAKARKPGITTTEGLWREMLALRVA